VVVVVVVVLAVEGRGRLDAFFLVVGRRGKSSSLFPSLVPVVVVVVVVVKDQ